MDARAVQAFVVVLQNTSSCTESSCAACALPPDRPTASHEAGSVADQKRPERRRLIGQCGENETVPLIDRQAVQREIAPCRKPSPCCLKMSARDHRADCISSCDTAHDPGGGKSTLRASAQHGSRCRQVLWKARAMWSSPRTTRNRTGHPPRGCESCAVCRPHSSGRRRSSCGTRSGSFPAGGAPDRNKTTAGRLSTVVVRPA